MEKVTLVTVCLVAFCAVASATKVGITPSSPVCWHERLFNPSWSPSCYFGLYAGHYWPQQCRGVGQCWCVDFRGQSRSVVYHSHGTVDCLRTMNCNETKNEIYNNCAPASSCEPSCSDSGLKLCTLQCEQRCTCPPGYARDSDDICVPKDQCSDSTPTCDLSLNEEYSLCAPHQSCEPTCGAPAVRPCPAICTQRCTCPPGHARNERNVCVPQAQCPKACNVTLNEVYSTCAPASDCEPSCDDTGLKACTLQCEQRCTCPPNHARNEHNVCVPREQCPVACNKALNEVYSTCAPASGCEPSCDDTGLKACTLQCEQRCTCPPNHARNEHNVCVPREQCPVACNKALNEVYSTCAPASGCEPSCDDTGLKACTLQCEQRCTCPPNHARNEFNVCVPREQCPVACNKELNEVFSTCAPAVGCEPSCVESGRICTLACTQRCTCPAGHSRDAKGVCIPTENCTDSCDASLNESLNECAPICDATCDEPRKPCSLVKSCNKRCACAPGMVRNSANLCVEESQCPEQNPSITEGLKRCEGNQCYCLDKSTGNELPGTRRPRDQYNVDCDFLGDCPAPMTFSTCASSCPPTCGDPMPKCVRMCELDCQCPPGTVRASATNLTCIAVSDCPEPHSCQYVKYTATEAMPTPMCEDDGTWAPTQCFENATCFCADESGAMIPNTMTDTPIVSTTLPTCADARACDTSLGKQFNLCAKPCDATCGEPDKICEDDHLCTARCACKPGHLLDESSNRCVPVEQCPDRSPQVCNDSKNEVFSNCAANCDATCEQPLIACSLTRRCNQRCTCPEGHVRDANDVCVPYAQCLIQPRTQTQCQLRRAANSNPMLMDAFIPDCDPSTGLYMPTQCYGFLNDCWCVDVATGRELRGSRSNPSWEFDTDCKNYEEPISSGDGAPPAPEDIPPPPPAP